MILLSVGIWGVIGAVFFTGLGDCSGKTEGHISAKGKPIDDFEMDPPACHSGEHEGWFGVWAAPKLEKIDGRKGFRGGLKVVKNHAGAWEVYVENPSKCRSFDCQVYQVKQEHCSRFDVHVENTNTTVNDIRVRRGHAHLTCKFPEGGTLSASLKFSGCM